MKPILRLSASICAVTACITSSNAYTAVSDYLFPYNQPTPVQFNQTDLQQSYDAWKGARITSNNAGGNGRYRVMGGVTDSTTVSEGIAYGMILSSLFDDQTEFDGLWLFAKDHFDNQNMMHWYIGNPGQLLGMGAATDGDVDMAIALINACIKTQEGAWPSSSLGINYCADATSLIENIYDYEVDQPGPAPFGGLSTNVGGELMPGDQWYLQNNYPDGVVNLSYFPPGFFRVFGKFTGEEQKWQDVIDRNYALIDEVQAKPGNCSGLIPNWNKYNGDVQVVPWQPNNSGWWSYDAARFGWRIATDAMWYGTPDAMETVNEVASFFANVGMSNIGGEYQLNGQRSSGTNNFFIGNAAAPIVAANQLSPVVCGEANGSVLSSAQDAYDQTRGSGYSPTDYYAAYWRLINMMLMTGNFPNLYEMANQDGGSPSVSLSEPMSGQMFNLGETITLSANASDDGQVTAVTFFVDGSQVGIDSSLPYSIDLNNLTEGSYTIYAQATDNDNNTSESSSVTISVGSANEPPIAAFDTNTDELTVNLDASASIDLDGIIQSYSWNFGDNSSGSGLSTSHTYSNSGTYPISLTVTDDEGASSTTTQSVTVSSTNNSTGACEYEVINEWNTGFVAEIRITNTGNQVINSWSLSWSYSGSNRIANGWNANYGGSNPYTATPFGWNSTINPGQSITIGLQGSKPSGSAETPTLSGSVCD